MKSSSFPPYKHYAQSLFLAICLLQSASYACASHDLIDAQAQLKLGVSYEQGRGVAKDVHKAKVWFDEAAEQGVYPE